MLAKIGKIPLSFFLIVIISGLGVYVASAINGIRDAGVPSSVDSILVASKTYLNSLADLEEIAVGDWNCPVESTPYKFSLAAEKNVTFQGSSPQYPGYSIVATGTWETIDNNLVRVLFNSVELTGTYQSGGSYLVGTYPSSYMVEFKLEEIEKNKFKLDFVKVGDPIQESTQVSEATVEESKVAFSPSSSGKTSLTCTKES